MCLCFGGVKVEGVFMTSGLLVLTEWILLMCLVVVLLVIDWD